MEYKCWREITWGHMVGLQSWSDENVPPHICVIWSDDMNMQGNILVSVMTKLMCWECRARESEEFQEQRMLIGRRGHKILRPVFFFFFPSGVHIFSTSERVVRRFLAIKNWPFLFPWHSAFYLRVMTARMHCMFFQLGVSLCLRKTDCWSVKNTFIFIYIYIYIYI